MDQSAFDAGSYVMSLTPFDPRGDLDEEALREHVRWLHAAGIRVVPASASSGEGTLLSDAEVFRVWEVVVDEVAGRYPVIAANRELPTARENIRYAHEARDRGLDAIQIYPPTLGHVLKPTPDMTSAFYDEILDAVDLPVLISSNESTGFEVPLHVHERLLDRHDTIVAFYKNNTDFLNCATFYARMAPRTTVLTGYLRLPMAFTLGGTGELDYLQNLVPRTCRRLHDALHAGDAAAASEAYTTIVDVLSRTSRFWVEEGLMRVPTYKAVLRLLGRPGTGLARAPFRPLDADQEKRLAALVDDLGLARLEGLD